MSYLRIAGAVSLVACAGCGNSGNIVGTWVDDSQGLTVTFDPDGTYHQLSHKGPASVDISGTYTFSRDHLTLRYKGATFQNVPERGQEDFKDNFAHRPDEESTIEFVTPDVINMKRGVTSETFNRK